MKKLRNIVFIITLMLLVFGCGKKKTKTKATTNDTTEKQTTSDNTTERQTTDKDTSEDTNPDVYYYVAFLNWDNSLITSTTVKEGDTPTYSLTNPTREKDDNYYYVFSGWSPEIGAVDSDTTYIAQFNRYDLPYTISFDLDGGTSTDTIKTIKTDELSKDLFSFKVSKKGYSFIGWSYDNTIIFDKDGNKINDITMQENMTFKAVYDKLYHSVKFVDYDETELYSTNIQDGEVATYPNSNPTRNNDENYSYAFIGWNPQLGEVYSDTVYVAQYSETDLPYTISFDLDGGTSTYTIKTIKTDELSKDLFSFNITKKNYAFSGWSYNNVLVFDSTGNMVNDVTMSSNMTFKAEYREAVILTIYYTLYNPRTNEVIETYQTKPEIFGDISETREYSWNTNVNLYANLNAGYTFDGWYSDGLSLSNQTNYNYMMWEEDFTIEARIKYTSYSLNVYANNTSLGQVMIKEGNSQTWYNMQTKQKYYTEEVTIAAYTKTDVRFLGWYDENNKLVSTNAIYKFVISTRNYRLEAKWNSFSISYTLNGGTNNENNIATYNIDMENFTLLNPTKEGYTFAGWYYNDELITEICTGNACNMTVEASWSLYTITTTTNNSDAGTYTSYTNKGVTEGETINLTASAKTGYTFAGWYLDDEQASIVENYSFEMPNHSITLEARWTINSYNLTLSKNYDDAGTLTGAGLHEYKQNVTIVATENEGYTFVGWYNTKGLVSEYLEYSFSMPYNDVSLEARYSLNSYVVTLVNNNDSAGSISGSGAYVYKSSVTITATLNLCYNWLGWYKNNKKVSSDLSYSFEMANTDLEFEAKYELNSDYIDLYNVFYFSSTETTITINGIKDKKTKNIIVPNYVTNISEGAFRGCSYLQTISIPFVGNKRCTSADESNGGFGIIFGKYSYDFGIATEQGNNGKYYIPSDLHKVIITDCEFIGHGSFYNCNNLTSIVISDSVTSIGQYAFYNCSSLTSITILDGVTSIGQYAFNNCSSLTSVEIPNSVTSIGQYTFSNCTCEILWGDNPNITKIGENAFYGYQGTNIRIPDSVITIDSYAFNSCSKLTNIEISNSVTSIGEKAFCSCSCLTNITIPNSVTNISLGAFSGCSSLTSMSIPFVGNKSHVPTDIYQYPFGYIFGESSYTGGTSTTQKYYGGSTSNTTSSTYYIPTTLKEVIITGSSYMQFGAFYNCSSLTSITIPNSVTSIGQYAFYNCSSLTSIEIPDSVASIGQYAFYNCTCEVLWGDNPNITIIVENAFCEYQGTNIKIPDSVITIDSYAFNSCSKLTNIEISNSVTSIGQYAFNSCSKLTNIEIPNSVTCIEQYAFNSCSKLKNVYYNGIIENWCSISFASSYSNPMVYASNFYLLDSSGEIEYNENRYSLLSSKLLISDGITSIGQYAFYNFSWLTNIEIPNSVASIGQYAFEKCTCEILWGDNPNITKIGENAFSGYQGKSVVIPNCVTSIGQYAFYNCSSLTSITIPDGVTSIGQYAFYNCSSLTNITIPDGVTSIGKYAFYNCSSLTIITIPDGVTSIGQYAFYNCSSLTSITIPDGVTSIGLYAFYNCGSLTSITIPDGVTSIGEWAFYNCSSLTSIIIPNGVTRLYRGTFSGCSSLISISIPFVGDKAHTSTDTYQYSFGYIFGIDSYEGGRATDQSYYYSSSTDIKHSYYYIPTTLREVIITGSCYIQYGAFENCSRLTNIEILNGVTGIGAHAFYNCSSLTNIKISDGVTSIGQYAFYNCSSLTNITIPNSVTSIGSSAFSGCSSLMSISIPFVGDKAHTATDTYQYPFGYIFGTSSYTGGTPTEQHYIGSKTNDTYKEIYHTYYIPTSLREVIITGCKDIQYGAFYNCNGLTSIVISNSVKNIYNYAFYNCSNLTNVYYEGTSIDWSKIAMNSNNGYLINATRYYFSETQPTESGNYWHYDDNDEIIIW